MKIKNIITGGMAAFAVLLVLLVPEDVFADRHGGGSGSSAYNCGCNGDFFNYYELGLKPHLFQSFTHNLDDDGNFVSDKYYYYGLSANNDESYFVKITTKDEGFMDSFVMACIRISSDTSFEIFDYDGNIVGESSSCSECNNKYYNYNFINNGYSPYIHEYDSGFNFEMIDISLGQISDYLDELARYLCGESTELPSYVTVAKRQPTKDLEPPLNVSVNGVDNNIFETKSKSVKIRWEQSNINLTGYKTVFYMRESGRCRKTIFNEWQDVKTPWLFDKDYVTAKYCNNNLKYHEYKWWTDQSKLGDYANAALYGEETGGLMCEHAAVDFMIRNEKEDEDGTLHYSSWIYVNCFEDGTYQIYEMNEDYTLDEDPDETGNINTDSTIYDDETVYDEDDVDASLGIGDAKDFVGGMSDLINSLRSFPALFSKIFSFFPSWVLGMIGMLFIAVLLSRLFL